MARYKHAWYSERDHQNRRFDSPDTVMYLQVETKEVVMVSSVTSTDVTDLLFDDVVSLGLVYPACVSLNEWTRYSDEQREQWIADTVEKYGDPNNAVN